MDTQEGPATPEDGAERAARTAEAWDLQRLPDGVPWVARTSRGEVALEGVQYQTDEASGVAYLDVTVAGPDGGDPHYRVVNPPLLVPDPEGDVEVRGARFREDPLAALAEVIGRNGGAMARRRRRL